MAFNQLALAEPDETTGRAVSTPQDGPRHRLRRQRTVSRGSTVLGVAAMAAVGAGGVAAAEGKAPIPVSVPDLPLSGSLTKAVEAFPADTAAPRQIAPDAGQAMLTRVLAQARSQQTSAEEAERTAAAAAAAKEVAARKVREDAARKKAEEEARRADAARAAAEARALSYVRPVTSFTLTAGFGETSSLWATVHTGQDFAAPTGTPVMAVHGGTVTSAGWAGSYGYRIVLTLPDGTQLWYCHLSSMVKTSGAVTTGDVIGRVGATGNVTGPHLHLEVRPGGGDPVDPLPWLRDHGVSV